MYTSRCILSEDRSVSPSFRKNATFSSQTPDPGLPILIVVFLFAKHVSRHPTLTNFLFSWVLYSVSYSLLKYSTVEATQDTQSVICLVQSALIHGTPIMYVCLPV